MPEEEFELYLSLLSRFLRLDTGQRGEIADELRDHLEERLDELSREGLSRADAIRAALDEFGDAAELAAHFTEIARQRRRKIIMRFSVGTVAALTAALLVGTAFWPKNVAVQLPERAIAQQDNDQTADGQAEPGGDSSDANPAQQTPTNNAKNPHEPIRDARTREIEARIDAPVPRAEYIDDPLETVLQFLADETNITIIPDRSALDDEGVSLAAPINLELSETRLRDILSIILPPLDLDYFVRDGVLHVTSETLAWETFEVRIYNCRDLLENYVSPAARNSSARRSRSRDDDSPAPQTAGDVLIDVIVSATPGPWNETKDDGGTISEFNGLLVVKQNYKNHRKIQQVLTMIRTAHGLGPDNWGKPMARARASGISRGFADRDRRGRDDVDSGEQSGLFKAANKARDTRRDSGEPDRTESKRGTTTFNFGGRRKSDREEVGGEDKQTDAGATDGTIDKTERRRGRDD